jgi:hypothetical protein
MLPVEKGCAMSPNSFATRRAVLAGIGAVVVLPLRAAERPRVTVHKDPGCGCCGAWVEHLEASGFPVTAVNTPRMNAVKARLGVPADLASCHTAEVGGYVIEGHVPAAAIDRLLAERPPAKGLAVPGMPVGSPGMEGGEPEEYDVVLFGPGAQRTFARFRGGREI